ncbi:MAG TPA: sigma-70 family RNA polymerase sigma factor [Bryobacteraceae bacterium]|nr:sigma-70 family RNA polymerase sigma factor [Bryobacteraceae bacterium]
MEDSGPFQARYVSFLETITNLRPALHRYCSRMIGSVLDGEDVVQNALFQAFRKLDTYNDSLPLKPWLFRIAHNCCIDFLRRGEVRREAEAEVGTADVVPPADAAGPALGRAVEHLVLALPPMERACVLLKDVFDYSIEETSELVDSSVGGVKAALHRGRNKLASLPAGLAAPRAANPELRRLLDLYVERFNNRDWDGLRNLISADARLRVADRFDGRLSESPYFGRYAQSKQPWRLAVGEVDGEAAVIAMEQAGHGWRPVSAVRLDVAGGRIVRIVDYTHCRWILSAATAVHVSRKAWEPYLGVRD